MLKIGVLVDSVYCSKYVKELVDEIEVSNLLEIQALIIQDIQIEKRFICRLKKVYKKKGFFYLLGKLLYLIILRLEKYTLSKHKFFNNHYKLYELFQSKENIVHIKPTISDSGFVYRYTEEDILIIKALGLDVIIRCGSGILRGKILEASKHGIISFHHGDNTKYRGGPAGFWEVLNKDPSSGFVIQRLTNELDGGDILFRGAFPTQKYYSLNQAMLYTKSNIYMKLLLENIASKNSLNIIEHGSPYDSRLYQEPNLYEVFQYLLYINKSLFLKFKNKLMNKKTTWNVSYMGSEWINAVLWKGKTIPNPKNHYLADPFVFYRDDLSYIFVEDFDFIKNKGVIRLYKIEDDNAIDFGVIIEEEFHMSFPYIFEYDGEVYMCPETSQNQEIRLYQCVEFPCKWIFHSVAIKNIHAVDSMIFKQNGLWWLFTNIDNSKVEEYCSELSIFYSDNPLSGKWLPHKKNPVIVDSDHARNGGFIILDNNYYRVSQRQGFLTYGKSISVRKIDKLNKNQYSESEYSVLNADFNKSAFGMHHMHSDKSIIVYDYCKYT